MSRKGTYVLGLALPLLSWFSASVAAQTVPPAQSKVNLIIGHEVVRLTPQEPAQELRLAVAETGANVAIGGLAQTSKMKIEGNISVGRDYGNTAAPPDGMIIQGNVGIGITNPTAKLDVAGTIQTNVLQLTGGADLSEQFEVKATSDSRNNSPQQLQPGLLVSIDPLNPGKLVVSGQAYDRKVAGVISGAGGLKTGVLMGQSGSVADGDYPVALSGRVYCWADAANGSIEPGDLLTASNTPGHAMKVSNHKKAQGAVIGKAMSGLKQGRGMVLVLVTLQ